jgi:hypothetical protein
MKWVTWENIGIDRMGCAWLIRRFLDPDAQFNFVPRGQTSFEAGAEPFDIPGVRLSHRRAHSTFHTMLEEYSLRDPILQRIAQIVDEADTAQDVMVEPAAPGLDVVCRGLRLTSPDDATAVERGCLIYEALYAQLAADPAS